MTQLFNNEYFGIGLIVTIAFLTILFIIVLIMALKDAKKRKDELVSVEKEENKEEPKETEFAFKEEEPKVELEVPEIKEAKEVVAPVVEEPIEITPTETKEETTEENKELDDFKTADFSFGDLKESEVSEEKEPTVNIDFEALAESLRSELDKETKAEEPKEEEKPVNLFDNKDADIPSIDLEELKRFANELQNEEEKPLLENKEEEIKVVEDKNTAPVYLNSEEKVVKEEKVYGPPVKMKVPTMEMPKFASAPAGSVKVSKVEPVEPKKEEEVITPSFESIENETFSLK